MTSEWPRCAAMKTGVRPSFVCVLTYAPSSANTLTVSSWPSRAATKTGLRLAQFVTFEPQCIRRLRAALPKLQAVCDLLEAGGGGSSPGIQ